MKAAYIIEGIIVGTEDFSAITAKRGLHHSQSCASVKIHRFAFLNKEDVRRIQDMLSVATYVENAESSKTPRGAQVGCARCTQ